MQARSVLLLVALASALSACGSSSPRPLDAGTGPDPALPPDPSLIPVVDIAPAEGWPAGVVPFAGGRPSGAPETLLAGFVASDGDAYGRPVGVAIDTHGALLVADDVGNVIWRVTASAESSGGAL